jgi:ribosomal protein S6
MKKYELTILISPDLTEQEVRVVEDEISSLIEEKGTLIGLSTPTKRELGYEINKKRSAYVMDIRFSSGPDFLLEFSKKLKEKKEILRHILLIKEDPKPEKEPRKKENKPVDNFNSPLSSPTKTHPKVEIGDIDKKIDEILSE